MQIFINKQNLLHNVKEIKKQLLPQTKFCAIVKANAYGHGLKMVALCLQDEVDYFAVARISEGLVLRRCGVLKPILVLNPNVTAKQIKVATVANLTLTIDNCKQLALLARCNTRVHIKVDSGMGRIGVQRLADFIYLLKQCKKLDVAVEGVYSHFASDINSNPKLTFAQFNKFNKFCLVAKTFYPNVIRHVCNTTNTLFSMPFHLDMVRVGIGIYGCCDKKGLELKPCKTVCATVVQTKNISKGAGVGYNHTFVANKDTNIAILDVGYGDGLPRKFDGHVMSNGCSFPVIGDVCMDMLMIKNVDNKLKTGDKVLVFGEYDKNCVKVEKIAKNCDTIPYELLCNLRER